VTGIVSQLARLHLLPPVELYHQGIELTTQGEPAGQVYCIMTGIIKLTHIGKDGKQRVTTLASGGELVGAESVLLGAECLETAVTLTPCRLARWSAAEFTSRLATDGGFAAGICRVAFFQNRRLRSRLLAASGRTARERFLDLLLNWPEEPPARAPYRGAPSGLPLSREDLSAILAVSPFQVSRLVTALEKDGVIRRTKQGLQICSGRLQKIKFR